MSIIRPIPAESLRSLRNAFPKAEEAITSRIAEVLDYTGRAVDGSDRDFFEMSHPWANEKKLEIRAENSGDQAEAYALEKFESQQQRDERLQYIRETWNTVPESTIKDNFATSGSGSIRFRPLHNIRAIGSTKEHDVKTLDDTSLAVRTTLTPMVGLKNRLMESDDALTLLGACADPALEKLPFHTEQDLKEAAQLAVLLGKPELIQRFIQLTGKLPSTAQQNKLMRLATSEQDKEKLRNIFMKDSLWRFRQAYNGEIEGKALVKALIRISGTGTPDEGHDMALFLKGLNFKRVKKWTNPSSWLEYLASRKDAGKN